MMYAPPNPLWQPLPPMPPMPKVPEGLQEEGPAEKAPRGLWTDRFSLLFGIVVTLLTLAAVALGALAPSLAQRTVRTVPSGWSAVYNATPTAADWHTSARCAITGAGLDAIGTNVDNTSCPLTRSTSADLTSAGLQVDAMLAPGATFSQPESAYVQVDNGVGDVTVAIDASGTYALYGRDNAFIGGTTSAWHSSSYAANTISLRLVPAGDGSAQAIFAVNGEDVATIAANTLTNATIAVGAAAHGEAVYTHVTVYSASANG